MRIFLSFLWCLFVFNSISSQGYSNISQTSFSVSRGQSVSFTFSYNNMNGMNGPIRRASSSINTNTVLAINALSDTDNTFTLGSFNYAAPVDEATCNSTDPINFTFTWNDPVGSGLWNPVNDGDTFVIELADYISSMGMTSCLESIDPSLPKVGDYSYINAQTITLTFVDSSSIPTLGEWGLMLLSLSILIVGLIYLRFNSYSLSNNS